MKTTTKQLMMALVACAVSIVPAKAQGHDHFAHNIPSVPPPPNTANGPADRESLTRGMPITGARTPVVVWFEALDDTVDTLKVTDAEKLVLNQPLNREAERVQKWINTAHSVINRYRTLATTVRRMAIPPGATSDLKDFRDLKAGWYDDVAGVYEDLIVPRKPPKTQEELDGQIEEIKGKATSLDKMRRQLEEMDQRIRIACGVHGNKHTDGLVQYVLHK